MQRKKIKYEINGIVENKKNYDTCVKNAVIFHVAYIYKTKSKGFFFRPYYIWYFDVTG